MNNMNTPNVVNVQYVMSIIPHEVDNNTAPKIGRK